MRPDIFLATIGRGSNGSNALEVTEDRAAVTAESQDNIINRVNNLSQYGPSWHYVPGIGVAGTAYAEVPGSALGDLAFTRASSKTRTNAAGVVETIGNNVPPHDYRNADGTLSTFPRLNLEPQRTNGIRNSSMVGAVAGSPGTLPTNWSTTNAGLTRTIVGVGIENGLPYIDIRFNGIANSTVALVAFEGSSAITASVGQVWSSNAYVKNIATPAQANQVLLSIYEWNLVGAYLSEGSVNIRPQLTTSLKRFDFVRTLVSATTARVSPLIQFILTNGAAYDFTIRIAAPQMEPGAYATTWVPTTTAAVTRLADNNVQVNPSTLVAATAGSWFMDVANYEFEIKGTTLGTSWIGDNEGNFIGFTGRTSGYNGVIFAKRESNTATTIFSTTSKTLKACFTWSGSNLKLFVDGVKVYDNNSFSNFAAWDIFQLNYATREASYKLNQAALFRAALTDAQCIQMTTL